MKPTTDSTLPRPLDYRTGLKTITLTGLLGAGNYYSFCKQFYYQHSFCKQFSSQLSFILILLLVSFILISTISLASWPVVQC